MNKKNTNYLFKKYKKLFPAKDRKDLWQSLMGFGFSCGDGWFNIIDKLCECIQQYINNNDNVSQVIVTQVKEKFGGLRFYVSNSDEIIDGMIWLSEHLSYSTCEECGAEGTCRECDNWFTTLCDKHYKLWKENKLK